jgi:CubicO group peptidase (beta-lactamase class C family)
MVKTILWLAGLMLVCATASADEGLRTRLEQIRKDTHTTGLGVAVIRPGQPVEIIALGLADAATKKPVTEQTTFRTASAGKIFTALAIMRLVEEGKLSLDTRLRDVAPEVAFFNPWEDVAPVRIAHLLEHTTGWDELHFAEYSFNNVNNVPILQALALHPHSRTSRWMPGTRYAYSNSGTGVASYIVEKVARMPFETFVKETVFRPLSMGSATYLQDKLHGATGHDSTGLIRKPFMEIIYHGCGSTMVTPADMAKLMQMFLQRGGGLFSPATIKRMEHAQTTVAAKAGLPNGPGMGLQESGHKGYRFLGHHGDIQGSHTQVRYQPDLGIGFVVMVNSDADTGPFESAIVDSLMAQVAPRKFDAHLAPIWQGVDGLYTPTNWRLAQAHVLAPLFAKQFSAQGDHLLMQASFGKYKRAYPALGPFAASTPDGLASAVRAVDPLVGEVLVVDDLVYRRIHPAMAYLAVAATALWLAGFASSLLFALVWVPRRLWGKLSGGPALAVRAWPLAGCLLLVALLGSVLIVQPKEADIGLVSPFSVWIMLATAGYGVLAALGAWTVWRERAAPMGRLVYWTSAAQTCIHLLATLYFGWHGMIGYRTWA